MFSRSTSKVKCYSSTNCAQKSLFKKFVFAAVINAEQVVWRKLIFNTVVGADSTKWKHSMYGDVIKAKNMHCRHDTFIHIVQAESTYDVHVRGQQELFRKSVFASVINGETTKAEGEQDIWSSSVFKLSLVLSALRRNARFLLLC